MNGKNLSLNLFLLAVMTGLLFACSGSRSPNSESIETPNGDAVIPSSNNTSSVNTDSACPISNPPVIKSQQGEATFYAVDGPGNCSLPLPDNLMIAAMNDPQYAGSAVCGACLSVSGPNGKVVVKVVDRCPECLSGDLDLSRAAFAKIADPAQGRADITWFEVPCDTAAAIQYHLKEGSNQWWVAVQVRNHRHRIAKLQALNTNNQYQPIARANYNYFVAENGLGAGPLAFRITDIHGNQIEDSSIPLKEKLLIDSHAQFSVCQ